MVLHIGRSPCNKKQFLDDQETQQGFKDSNQSADSTPPCNCNMTSRASHGKKKPKKWQIAGSPLIGKAKNCPDAIVRYAAMQRKNNHNPIVGEIRKHLAFLDWKIECITETHDKAMRFRYTSPDGEKTYFSLVQICQDLKENMCSDDVPAVVEPESVAEREYCQISKQTASCTIESNLRKRKGKPLCSEVNVVKIGRREKMTGGVSSVPSDDRVSRRIGNRRTVLSRLIDEKIVSTGDRVEYRGKGKTLKTGTISSDGITCICCNKLFALTSFEAHAGSTLHRPSANIFLEEGRSLFDCQKELPSQCNERIIKKENFQANLGKDEADSICSVCQKEGDLILCDGCPSCFHATCVGLEFVPEGKWFCASCRCAICREIEEGKTFVTCEQCELNYHPACLPNSRSSHEEKCFCSDKCEKIHMGLHQLVGKPMKLSGEDDLSCTFLKFTEPGVDAASLKKLKAALEVMHDCFEPSKDFYTGRDIGLDIIYNRGSKLRRLNFKGFFTVVVEKNGVVVSVAHLRIFGNKVAEVPLVGTLSTSRKSGMCRKLMKKIEEKLKDLGVERLILPAIPATLDTWTNSFGFSQMTEADKAMFSNYTFLNFEKTIGCQKFL